MKVSTENGGVVKLASSAMKSRSSLAVWFIETNWSKITASGMQSDTRVLSMPRSGSLVIYSSPGSYFGSR